MKRVLGWTLWLLLLAGISACGGETSDNASPPAADGSSAEVGVGKVEVNNVWGRSAPAAAANAAFYMQIVNNSPEDEHLMTAKAEMCDATEFHEVVMKEGGVMSMQPVEGGKIDVPAKQTVELKSGGLHLMCIGKKGEFKLGETYPITLVFEKAGEMEVLAVILEAADDMNMDMDMNMNDGGS